MSSWYQRTPEKLRTHWTIYFSLFSWASSQHNSSLFTSLSLCLTLTHVPLGALFLLLLLFSFNCILSVEEFCPFLTLSKSGHADIHIQVTSEVNGHSSRTRYALSSLKANITLYSTVTCTLISYFVSCDLNDADSNSNKYQLSIYTIFLICFCHNINVFHLIIIISM